jgi:hypothetical protein
MSTAGAASRSMVASCIAWVRALASFLSVISTLQ